LATQAVGTVVWRRMTPAFCHLSAFPEFRFVGDAGAEGIVVFKPVAPFGVAQAERIDFAPEVVEVEGVREGFGREVGREGRSGWRSRRSRHRR
jgi:hypothetical protein